MRETTRKGLRLSRRRGGKIVACILVTVSMHARSPAVQLSGVLMRPVDIVWQEATTEDALLGLGERGGINILCDATKLEHQTITAEMKGALADVLLKVMQSNHLGMSQWEEETFLFWPLPDLTSLITQIKQGASLQTVGVSPDDFTAFSLVDTYLRERRLKPQTPGFELSAPLESLPPNVGDGLTAYVLSQILHGPASEVPSPPGIFDTTFWEKAKIWIQPDTDQGKPITMFRFGFSEAQYGRTHGWGLLREAGEAEREEGNEAQ